MIPSVIDESDKVVTKFAAVERHMGAQGRNITFLDRDVIEGLAVAVVNLELAPSGRQAWSHSQLVGLQLNTQ
jgi:hypothetical protein